MGRKGGELSSTWGAAGFAANLAVLSSLAAAADCEVFSDELNHASIVDGVRQAARGRLSVYRHCDVAHLEQLLAVSQAPRKLIVTDSLFSMDGAKSRPSSRISPAMLGCSCNAPTAAL